MKGFALVPIGYVKNPIKKTLPPDEFKDVVSKIKLKPFYIPCIEGIKDRKEIVVVFYFHKSSAYPFRVRPKNNPKREITGVFNSCSPRRPNFIGITVCKLIDVVDGTLTVKGLDAIDGTPVIDIKPHIYKL